jgi:hypothetical protein
MFVNWPSHGPESPFTLSLWRVIGAYHIIMEQKTDLEKRNRTKRQRMWLIAIAAFFLSLGAFWILLTPDNPLTNIFRAQMSDVHERVVTGPYPVREDFEELSANGVSVDVSLLDPKIPYERVLLDQERRNAQRYGIEMINFPMASILGQKMGSYYEKDALQAANAIDSIRKSQKVYLHCYLGEHRMVAVKKILMQRGAIRGEVVASY